MSSIIIAIILSVLVITAVLWPAVMLLNRKAYKKVGAVAVVGIIHYLTAISLINAGKSDLYGLLFEIVTWTVFGVLLFSFILSRFNKISKNWPLFFLSLLFVLYASWILMAVLSPETLLNA